jgi:hypothetical protein
MGLPTVSLSWDFTKINQRETYSSVNDATGFALFTLWRYAIDVLGWTVKYTCDGTTGPSSSSDHTDRLTTKAKCITRGTSTTAAQSFGVATDGGGADHLFAYLGSGSSPTGDDLFYIAYSPTGVYVPAGTATNTPTATDQVLVMNSLTLVGTGTNDRVVTIVGDTTKKHLHLLIYSNGALVREYWITRCTSTVLSAWNWNDPLIVGQVTAVTASNAAATGGGSMALPAGSTQGSTGNAYAKIGTTIAAVGGGGEHPVGTGAGGTFAVANPELNGGAPIVPITFGTATTNVEGKLGNAIDEWFPYSTAIPDGNAFGSSPSFQFIYANTSMIAWDGVNPLVTS